MRLSICHRDPSSANLAAPAPSRQLSVHEARRSPWPSRSNANPGAQEAIENHGVRVNCVAPGPVWTPLIPQSYDGDKLAQFGKQSPMKRPAQPVELAASYVFLASAESSYINGEVTGVTGGTPLG